MKIVKKRFDPFKVCYEPADISFQEYSRKIDKYTRNQIRKIYKSVFHKELLEENVIWAKYLIQYELSRQQYIKEGNVAALEPGTQFRNAYMAVRRKDINAVNENMKTLIAYDMKHYNEYNKERSMDAIKKAVEAKKSKCIGVTTGLSVYEAWVHCFKKNAKEHKNDEEITKFLLSEFPDHQIKSFYAVHACRINYNNGRYTNGVKPEVKSGRYVNGVEYKRASAKKVAIPAPAKPKAAKPAAKKVAVKKVTVKKVIVKKVASKKK